MYLGIPEGDDVARGAWTLFFLRPMAMYAEELLGEFIMLGSSGMVETLAWAAAALY